MASARAREPGISSSLPPRLHSIWSDEAWEDEEDDSPVLQPRRATENSSPAVNALSRRATDPALPHGLHQEFMNIPWFHPTLTRHQAEAELLQSEVGVYLLRPRLDKVNGSIKGYSVDVKCQHSVKHFQLSVTKQSIKFGQEIFKNTEALLKHFDNCPLIGDDTGKLFVLRHGYPRDIHEMPDYSRVTTHYVQDPKNGRKKIVRPAPTAATGSDSPRVTYSFGTKEGHLSKMGGRVKTWKSRWFVLRNEELSYYENEKDKSPIRTIKLREATSVSACEREDTDRKNVFKLVLPWRTFFFQASMPEIMEDWIRILDFKLKEIKQARAGLLSKSCPAGSPRTRSETT